MRIIAVMSGNEVSNIIVAESKEEAESVTLQNCIDITGRTDVKIGSIHNGIDFEVEITDFPDSDPNATLAE